MNNNFKKYLPIGTVVMLKGGSKRVMITGFCSISEEDQNTMFDYSGCMFPEGFLSSEQTALFNHDQIATVYHLGLSDDEEKQFKINLNALVSQMNVANNNTAMQPVEQVQPTQVSQNTNNVKPDEINIPPIGPGLPGYVAPVQQVQTQSVSNVNATTTSQVTNQNGNTSNFQFDSNW